MTRNLAETVMGGVVLAIAATFVWIFVQATQIQSVKGYEVSAKFLKVAGLTRGSDVRISGINVGSVTGRTLDTENFEAVIRISIKPDVKLPKDTIAAIASDGLLGGAYIRLKPGRAKETLVAGDIIAKTEDFDSVEDQVRRIIFLATD